ncbi:TRAP transporter small permease [Aureimonas flava]|uniref:TRAP transporter small permease protein n=1 Tax=Aureimonas flava TaxID=2320271 RepID=A0A3A1WQA4_9HYPH|nr:TRAP transporter small permease [Aureimonas flava]RIX99721.1 TRAP transporter small permease [Aureimonas flava]
MSVLANLLRRLIAVYRAIAGAAVILMMLHITLDVVLAYVWGAAPPGTIAIVSAYYMVIVAFLPLAMVEAEDGHISVEVVADLLPPPLQRVAQAVSLVVSFAVFAFLTAGSWSIAVEKWRIGAFIIERDTAVPVWPSYFLLPMGTALMLLALAMRFAALLGGRLPGPGDARPAELQAIEGETQ